MNYKGSVIVTGLLFYSKNPCQLKPTFTLKIYNNAYPQIVACSYYCNLFLFFSIL